MIRTQHRLVMTVSTKQEKTQRKEYLSLLKERFPEHSRHSYNVSEMRTSIKQ